MSAVLTLGFLTMIRNFLNAWRSLDWTVYTPWWQWPLILSFAFFCGSSCALGFHDFETLIGKGTRCSWCGKKKHG